MRHLKLCIMITSSTVLVGSIINGWCFPCNLKLSDELKREKLKKTWSYNDSFLKAFHKTKEKIELLIPSHLHIKWRTQKFIRLSYPGEEDCNYYFNIILPERYLKEHVAAYRVLINIIFIHIAIFLIIFKLSVHHHYGD